MDRILSGRLTARLVLSKYEKDQRSVRAGCRAEALYSGGEIGLSQAIGEACLTIFRILKVPVEPDP
jgi:hypothetical protein